MKRTNRKNARKAVEIFILVHPFQALNAPRRFIALRCRNSKEKRCVRIAPRIMLGCSDGW